ncbi:MAG TPA: 50S ribosomal protein L37ae [archaeon]|nr:50S ribosomal protein L37ae [archaeon]
MGDTKKVGSTGRFGARYGVGIRKKLLKVEPLQLQKQKCPNCGSLVLKRLSKGIFKCRKCDYKFVGGAYLPKTLTGGLIYQMVSQKKFAPESITALEKHKEKSEPVSEEVKDSKKESKESKKESKPKKVDKKTKTQEGE